MKQTFFVSFEAENVAEDGKIGVAIMDALNIEAVIVKRVDTPFAWMQTEELPEARVDD